MVGSSLSCVIPVKGPRPYFEEALTSIEKQGVDVEVIIQDGDIEPDVGQSDALNRGFAKAHGDWLFWLNADDVLLSGALAKVNSFISKNPSISWVAGDTVYVNAEGQIQEVRTDAKWRPWYNKYLKVWSGGPSAFFSRSLWERFGGFNTNFKYVMDTDLWTRWARAGFKFASLNDYIWGFRIHGGSKTASGNNKEAHEVERKEIFAKYELSHQSFWRNLTRAASFLDGSFVKRKLDTMRYHGKHWSEMM